MSPADFILCLPMLGRRDRKAAHNIVGYAVESQLVLFASAVNVDDHPPASSPPAARTENH